MRDTRGVNRDLQDALEFLGIKIFTFRNHYEAREVAVRSGKIYATAITPTQEFRNFSVQLVELRKHSGDTSASIAYTNS